MHANFLLNLNWKIRQICSDTVGITEISDIFAAYNKCSFQYAGRVMSTGGEGNQSCLSTRLDTENSKVSVA